MGKQMIDLSDKLEGYENYVTQDLDGEIYKYEYKPITSNTNNLWASSTGESAHYAWFMYDGERNVNWKESLVDLSTHVPYLIDGILTPIPKLMLLDTLAPDVEVLWEETKKWDIFDKKSSDTVNKSEQEEYTGASVNYYKVLIDDPTSAGEPYVAECNDIIEALKMSYAEGNIFKAVWRRCAARVFSMKKRGYDSGLYDAEKVVFFGNRLIRMENKND